MILLLASSQLAYCNEHLERYTLADLTPAPIAQQRDLLSQNKNSQEMLLFNIMRTPMGFLFLYNVLHRLTADYHRYIVHFISAAYGNQGKLHEEAASPD